MNELRYTTLMTIAAEVARISGGLLSVATYKPFSRLHADIGALLRLWAEVNPDGRSDATVRALLKVQRLMVDLWSFDFASLTEERGEALLATLRWEDPIVWGGRS